MRLVGILLLTKNLGRLLSFFLPPLTRSREIEQKGRIAKEIKNRHGPRILKFLGFIIRRLIGSIASRRLENPETNTEHFLGYVWKSPFGSIIGFCRGFFPVRLASLHCLGEPHSLRIAWSSTCPLLDQSDANHELR